jgi:hypothetical protein
VESRTAWASTSTSSSTTKHVGVRRDEVPLMVARVLGFKAAGVRLKDAVEKALARVLAEDAVLLRDEAVPSIRCRLGPG